MSEANIINLNSQILFIVGPTASGKSGLAMEVARKFNGEIICADSQTLRKSLDIGTAKPSGSDQQEIKHHLIDVIEPYARFSVNEFKILAQRAINDIAGRDKIPIIVGGTGLYIDSLFFDFSISDNLSSKHYKNELELMSVQDLQEIIKQNKYPMPINQDNSRHLVGVILREGKQFSDILPIQNALIYGLLPEQEELKKRINSRVDHMFISGLVDEVRSVIKIYGNPPENLDAIGYGIVGDFLDSKIDENEAREKIKQGHWQYARRQKSWFKRNKYIQWFNNPEEALKKIVQDIDYS